MSAGARVAAAAASGYILGRTKKLKLAIMVGSTLAGRRLATDPRGLLRQADEFVESRPELAKLSEQVRTTLFAAARAAAVGTASQRIDRLSDAIRDRSDRLTGAIPAVGEATETVRKGRRPGEDDPADDSESEEPAEEPEEELDEESAEEPERKRRPKKKTATKTSAQARKRTSSARSGSTSGRR
ncbi:hypothetical protein [Jiangella asiatica]|uniref:DNA primase n=1 Tax=Jiangella asiatica TaxID=2530372 RepID=A0A4R5CKY1_9ACTN|nr:hypothetical protein [Jiangella asiatica]TDD99043.1 hypothetical protein E1269_27815 [Jiangella asiatica]